MLESATGNSDEEDFRDYKSDLPDVLEQHYIFHSVLNLLSIKSPAYDKDFDIFK